jgi:CPA2 family monovalent cation:H+ antiporter-2
VASTVVLLRALTEGDLLETIHGRVAIGWLIVEDLFTVIVLVLLPALAVPLGGHAADGIGAPDAAVPVVLALALLKSAVFVVLMLVAGARVIPRLLARVADTGSRELFTLAVLATALGIAFGSAEWFGVSLALGAFLAGIVVGESDLSRRAAEDALPLRDAFAVLFFVSVGMLFDPSVLVDAPLRVAAVVAVIIAGKGAVALLIVRLLGHPLRTGLTVAVGLAQVGEFSFILAARGRTLDLFPAEGSNLVLAGALFSITLNPLLFRLIAPMERWLARAPVHEQHAPEAAS